MITPEMIARALLAKSYDWPAHEIERVEFEYTPAWQRVLTDAEVIEDYLAQAWDEGFSHATGSINSDDQFDNPYHVQNDDS